MDERPIHRLLPFDVLRSLLLALVVSAAVYQIWRISDGSNYARPRVGATVFVDFDRNAAGAVTHNASHRPGDVMPAQRGWAGDEIARLRVRMMCLSHGHERWTKTTLRTIGPIVYEGRWKVLGNDPYWEELPSGFVERPGHLRNLVTAEGVPVAASTELPSVTGADIRAAIDPIAIELGAGAGRESESVYWRNDVKTVRWSRVFGLPLGFFSLAALNVFLLRRDTLSVEHIWALIDTAPMRDREPFSGQCVCGYDLGGLPTQGVCPECGVTYNCTQRVQEPADSG